MTKKGDEEETQINHRYAVVCPNCNDVAMYWLSYLDTLQAVCRICETPINHSNILLGLDNKGLPKVEIQQVRLGESNSGD